MSITCGCTRQFGVPHIPQQLCVEVVLGRTYPNTPMCRSHAVALALAQVSDPSNDDLQVC